MKKTFSNIKFDDEYMYVDVKNKTILIKADEEGVVVDVFQKPRKNQCFADPITSTWCLYNEKE